MGGKALARFGDGWHHYRPGGTIFTESIMILFCILLYFP
jgi:hypothetical protein